MKDKLFLIIFAGFVFLIMIASPLHYLLVTAGALEYENLGNVIKAEKTYEDDQFLSAQLNAIENGKAKLTDIYTNYIPGYNTVVIGTGGLKSDFNQPLYVLYGNIAADALKRDILQSEAVVTPDDVAPELSTEGNEISATETPSADSVNEPVDGAPIVPKIANYSSKFITSGVYGIDVEYEDGTKSGLITLAFNQSDSQLRAGLQSQAKEVNRLAAATPDDVNVYFYVCSRFQDSEYFADYVPGAKSFKPFVDEFLESLDPRIKYDRLKVNTLEDSIQKLFLTDHHWNAYGAYEAYRDIITMISTDSPSIGEPRPLGELHLIEEAEFYGSNARIYNHFKYTDTFFFYDYNLPKHDIKTTQDYAGFAANMKRYLDGKYQKSRNTDHYINFYPYTSYTKYPENNTGRVLLLLTDSYNRGVSELLGSNFDEAYVFDFRFMQNIGNYNEFLESKGITDVLFMQYSSRGVFNLEGDKNMLHVIKTN